MEGKTLLIVTDTGLCPIALLIEPAEPHINRSGVDPNGIRREKAWKKRAEV